jgi:phosphatidate cytidylyltransferase
MGGVLGVGLVGVLAADAGRLRAHMPALLVRRWFTWLVAVLLLLVGVGGPPLVTVALVAGVGLLAVHEYARLTSLDPAYRWSLAAAAVAAPFIALGAPAYWLGLPAAVAVAAVAIPVLRQDVERGPAQVGALVMGFVFIPWALGFVVLLRGTGYGGVLLAAGAGVALGDIGAYLAGRFAGHRRLAARLSPNKTLAGFAGQWVGAAAGVGLMWFALPAPLDLQHRLVLIAVVALGAVWGDLLESLLKRHRGVKDAASWVPGFGGLLDRIDSLLLTLPLAYLVTR